ncbi:hypothetical protein Syun_007409 [Stephania yunnanensis]|uniref:Uncharacterized protein n=1 Tax=Stephania yunnanensis TaxID=152371 RepID=A0AAP0KYF7_9MAGN
MSNCQCYCRVSSGTEIWRDTQGWVSSKEEFGIMGLKRLGPPTYFFTVRCFEYASPESTTTTT